MKKPLGTAGAIHMLPKDIDKKILIINGDVISQVNHKEIIQFSENSKSDATICAKLYETELPFGVIIKREINLKKYKKSQQFFKNINAGLYVIDSSIICEIEKDKYLNMPELMNYLSYKNKHIDVFNIDENWSDIGNVKSLETINKEWKEL